MLHAFLQNKVSKYSGWILIYDNVKNLRDIKNYLPRDSKAWGNGKIIITTTNSNIIDNSLLNDYHLLQIPELSKDEKISLFKQITNIKNMKPENEHELENFLNELPPFPSDISQAAHYIKNTGMAYSTYIKHIKTDDKNFIDSQKSTLDNISEYTKTRSNIVRLSVQKIISSNEEFRELLLLLSLVDLQNIPKDLLVAYKGEIIVNNFLQEMRKFSLIIDNNNASNNIRKNSFFIHYSTQHIIHNYLIKTVPTNSYENITLHIKNFMQRK